MVEYSPVDNRIHHQSAVDHWQIMNIWILCQNVLSGNISFSGNQDWKQNEVNHCLFPITMIISIDFSPFLKWKSENYQNVLSGNSGIGNHRMLLLYTFSISLYPFQINSSFPLLSKPVSWYNFCKASASLITAIFAPISLQNFWPQEWQEAGPRT